MLRTKEKVETTKRQLKELSQRSSIDRLWFIICIYPCSKTLRRKKEEEKHVLAAIDWLLARSVKIRPSFRLSQPLARPFLK